MQPGTCAQAATGTIGSWDTSSAAGSQTSTAGTTKPGATVGVLTRSNDLTAVAGAGSINSSGWSEATSIDTTVGYYTFSIKPPSGCTVTITGASVETKASASGPDKGAIATSADGFNHTSSITVSSTDTTSSPSLSVSAASSNVEVRVFGWDAGSTSGTLRIEGQLTLTGSFQ